MVILLKSFGLHFSDIVQIDELIEHAQFHNEQYGDNFLLFISKHYGELEADHEKEHQEEKEDHEELPLKHQSHVASATYFVLDDFKQDIKTPEFSEFQAPNSHYRIHSSSLHSEGFFQPPRFS